MEFFLDHWGSLFSVIGVAVSVIGLAWAIREARRARSAAQSAERATVETRDSIGRHLVATDLARAVGLIQRLKLLHRESRWEAALEQYQSLRSMISDIVARYPDLAPEVRERLNSSRVELSELENRVEEQVFRDAGSADWISMNESLNEIQSGLEDIASAMEFSG